MTPDQAREQMKLANESSKAQREANQAIIDSQIAAGDLILLRKAADSVIQLSQMASVNPT